MSLPYKPKLVCPRCFRFHTSLFCPIPFDFIMDACGVAFYGKQQQMIDSVDNNDETFVSAGNQLG